MVVRDPFRSSLMASSSLQRIAAISLVIGALWLAILWAVSLP